VEQANVWQNFAQRLLLKRHNTYDALVSDTTQISKILSTINDLITGSTIVNYAVGSHLKSLKDMTPIGRDVYVFKSH